MTAQIVDLGARRRRSGRAPTPVDNMVAAFAVRHAARVAEEERSNRTMLEAGSLEYGRTCAYCGAKPLRSCRSTGGVSRAPHQARSNP